MNIKTLLGSLLVLSLVFNVYLFFLTIKETVPHLNSSETENFEEYVPSSKKDVVLINKKKDLPQPKLNVVIKKKTKEPSYAIVVGIFKTEYFLTENIAKLRSEKIKFMTIPKPNGGTLLMVGSFRSKSQADLYLKEYKRRNAIPKDAYTKRVGYGQKSFSN